MEKNMQSLKPLFIIVPLYIFSMLFHTTTLADDQTDPVATVILNTICQVKSVLIKQSSPSDIEEMINQARKKGATGYKTDRYSGGKTGWTLNDSKGREMHRVIFSFVGHEAKEGRYLGPLITFQDSKEVHNWHRGVMSKYYKQIGTDKYDIENNCMANMELFKGSSGLWRTIITVECH
jgi:hypothetical protein